RHRAQAAAEAEQRLLRTLRNAQARGTGDREARARVLGEQGRADHHEVLDRRLISLRTVAGSEGTGYRRCWIERLRLCRRAPRTAEVCPDGTRTGRSVLRDVLR